MSRGNVIKFIIQDSSSVYDSNVCKDLIWGFNDDNFNHYFYNSFGEIDNIEASKNLLHLNYFTIEVCENYDKMISHTIPSDIVTMTFKIYAKKAWSAFDKPYIRGEIRAINENEQYFGDTIVFDAPIAWDWESCSNPNLCMLKFCKDVGGKKGTYFNEIHEVIRKAYQGDKFKNRLEVKLIITNAKYVKPFIDNSNLTIWVKRNRR